jgi:hypothetical protein
MGRHYKKRNNKNSVKRKPSSGLLPPIRASNANKVINAPAFPRLAKKTKRFSEVMLGGGHEKNKGYQVYGGGVGFELNNMKMDAKSPTIKKHW